VLGPRALAPGQRDSAGLRRKRAALAYDDEDACGSFGAGRFGCGDSQYLARGNPIERIGLGHDTHRLGPGDGLRLGGVTIPHDRRLIGHSDDALLGALAQGDIGELFPDTDAANRGRDSAEMLAAAAQRVAAGGFRVAHLDCVVLAERPKLLPYRDAIRARIAGILGIDAGQVGLKAKTGEGVGPVGREEAIVAEAVVLLTRAAP
jgi:2-C-methyl-D-erythritol 2,4-cyclodiphosphate synthase